MNVSIAKTLPFRIVPVDPGLVTDDQAGGERRIFLNALKQIFANFDAMLLLIVCEEPGHKYCSNAAHPES